MNARIEYLNQLEGTTFENEDGLRTEFRLLRPSSELELAELSSSIPCPIPSDIRELLRYARGFSGTWLQEIIFSKDPQYMGFGFDEIFPMRSHWRTMGGAITGLSI